MIASLCPYCKSDNTVVSIEDPFHVSCPDCGVRGPRGIDIYEAAAKWNTFVAQAEQRTFKPTESMERESAKLGDLVDRHVSAQMHAAAKKQEAAVFERIIVLMENADFEQTARMRKALGLTAVA